MSIRWVLTDEQWAKMEPQCLGVMVILDAAGTDNRRFVEVCVDCHAQAAPGETCRQSSANGTRCSNALETGLKADVFQRLFDAVSEQPDMEYAMVDATIVKVHRHGQGQRGTSGQAIGHSRGGMTTKILALTDALGNLVKFVLMPGQRHDTKGVRELIADVRFDALFADKAFDVNWLIQELGKRGAQVVISTDAPQESATGD